MSDTERATLTVKKRNPYEARKDQARMDFETLMLNEAFLRTLFTFLHTAGMFNTNYRPDGRDLKFYEGRRSLGLDILASAREFAGPDALLRILEAEKKTPIGGSSGRSRNSDNGNDDLDGDGNEHVPGTGLVFLDYGKPAGG